MTALFLLPRVALPLSLPQFRYTKTVEAAHVQLRLIIRMLFEGNERKQRELEMRRQGRLPPGQSLTLKWPVLQYGTVPNADLKTWDFRIAGLVEEPVRLSWEQFNALPKIELTRDFHCVTRWSRFDNRWEGVAFRELLKLVRLKPGAGFVLAHAAQG